MTPQPVCATTTLIIRLIPWVFISQIAFAFGEGGGSAEMAREEEKQLRLYLSDQLRFDSDASWKGF